MLGHCNHVAITGLCFIDKDPGQTGDRGAPPALQGHFHPLHGWQGETRRTSARREYVLTPLDGTGLDWSRVDWTVVDCSVVEDNTM